MCLYPRLLRNPKYKPNKKNGGIIPPVSDYRVTSVPVGCGNCMECMKQKQREWKIRLSEDIKEYKNGKFVTLTFSNEEYTKLYIETKYQKTYSIIDPYYLDNQITTRAVRLFLERWRKKYKKSVRHWLITELGHSGTENIHIHGIIWTDEEPKTIAQIWSYGFIWPRQNTWRETKNYVSEKTINYISKYITKRDLDHKNYKPIILTSAGIGKNYTNTYNSSLNIYNEIKTRDTYTTKDGYQIAMPIYWRNKIYTDEQKEKLWIQKLDRNERYVNGKKIDVSRNLIEYWQAVNHARKRNNELGYGSTEKNYDQITYEHELRKLKQAERSKHWDKKLAEKICKEMEEKAKEYLEGLKHT